MKGSVRKRGSTWSYYFDLGTVNGKRQKKEKGGFRTKKEAETALAKAINEYNANGTVFEPTEITVADYLNQWFDLYCKPNLKYNTQVGYLKIINTHLIPAFGHYKLKALTAAPIQEYINSKKYEGYSKNSITNILAVLSGALSYAVEPLHYIVASPCLYVKCPKIERKSKERIILTIDEWNRIKARFSGTRFYIPLMIGFYTGMRISEVFALTWDDIDFENHTISVNKQIVKRNFGSDVRKAAARVGGKAVKSSWYFTTPKTAESIRTVKIGETLIRALKEEKSIQLKNELRYGEYYTVHVIKEERDEKGNAMKHIIPVQKCVASSLPRARMVCIHENGEYTSTDSFKYCSRVIHNELQLAFDFHSLRHTHATMLIEAGAEIKDVQTRLGHNNITTTLQTYVHDTEKMSDRSVDIFERIATG